MKIIYLNTKNRTGVERRVSLSNQPCYIKSYIDVLTNKAVLLSKWKHTPLLLHDHLQDMIKQHYRKKL